MKELNLNIIKIEDKHREEVNRILIDEWESTNIIIRGQIVDGTKLDGFLAISDDKIVGLVTYLVEDNECEICTLNSFIENKGIGSKLIDEVKNLAIKNKCKRIKLMTTNDNVRGIEFYQRRGFSFAKLYKDAMTKARKLKPEIPMFADNGLPIKDEIEFDILL